MKNDECGEADVCRIGGKQFVKLGRDCVDMNTVVHELGHTVCMAHEHRRHDRDKYITLTAESDKNDPNNKKAKWDHTTLGLMYDYESVMHYECPHFFKPTSGAVKNCSGDELSVLDAEKINAFYDCKG